MGLNTIFFDGVDIQDYHAYVFAQNAYNAPERQYTEILVPGRNGTLLIDENRYTNIQTSYAVFLMEDFPSDIDNLRRWLASVSGYKRLEDTYHPDEFYMAAYAGETVVTTTSSLDVGKLLLNFNRKPQRYLKSGESVSTFTASGRIVNPEHTDARPLIRVFGAGTLTVGDTVIIIAAHENEYIDIDSEIEDAYCGDTNCNTYVSLTDFPVLSAGETEIVLDEGISRVDIKPRWWRL